MVVRVLLLGEFTAIISLLTTTPCSCSSRSQRAVISYRGVKVWFGVGVSL